MLRLLILLECDQCKEMLTSSPDSSSRLGIDWREEIYDLECGTRPVNPIFKISQNCLMMLSAVQGRLRDGNTQGQT